ncbi:MAG TPA: PKD domain-containing protein [Vicinamibacterales bacterium]
MGLPAALSRTLAALVVAAIAASMVGTSATAQSSRGQAPSQASQNNERLALHVKVREGTSIRLRGGRLVSVGNDDLSGLDAVLARYPGTRFERLFSRSEAALDEQRRRAEARGGRKTADLNLWYRLRLRPGTDVDGVIADLRALDIVETAYRQPRPAPMPVTPDFSAQQGYRDAATDGIDAVYAAAFPGGTGANVRIIDIEYSWNTNHEDLAGVNVIANGTPTDPFSNNDHGTAVLGQLWGRDNGLGVLGLAFAAWMGVVNAHDDGDYDLADAINIAASNLNPGDVMLIEQQTEGANGGCDSSGQTGCVAVEWVEAFYDAIVSATSSGIIVVEAAGNGNQDLDGTEYGDGDPNAFPAGRADSGAIIVGAGGAPGCSNPARGRLSFSNYGSRVNLQGWGQCVVTSGYGVDLQGVSMGNDAYTNSFGGTSSASPIVSGAAALLSSIAQQQGVLMTPTQVRSQLVATGTAQTGSDHIGPLPNLRTALGLFVPTADAGGPYSTAEGTYKALSAAGSSDPQGSTLTYAWDLDDDGQFDDSTSQTPTFTRVGRDGAFVVRVRVTDQHGAFADDDAVVTVTNVAPTVSLAAITTVTENTTTSISGLVSDAGWLDPLTATVDWGDGTTSAATGVLENSEPGATLTYSATHTYGDDGVFTVTVCGRDDDSTSAPCAVRTATVTNTNPTATIDLSSATMVNGVATIIAKEGQPTAFSARSTDPGSDDLTARWTWADGTADTVTAYLNAPPAIDPDPSPSINPRDVTDATSHTFGQACLYTVGFQSQDDDAGSASATVKVIVGGSNTVARGAGDWQTNYRPRPTALSESRRQCYLLIVAYMSTVFNEANDISTVQKAFNVLAVSQNGGSATQLLDRQLLAAWLNFADGAFTLTTMVDTDGVGGPDTAFGTVMAQVEAARLNPATSPATLLAFKNMLERIN